MPAAGCRRCPLKKNRIPRQVPKGPALIGVGRHKWFGNKNKWGQMGTEVMCMSRFYLRYLKGFLKESRLGFVIVYDKPLQYLSKTLTCSPKVTLSNIRKGLVNVYIPLPIQYLNGSLSKPLRTLKVYFRDNYISFEK